MRPAVMKRLPIPGLNTLKELSLFLASTNLGLKIQDCNLLEVIDKANVPEEDINHFSTNSFIWHGLPSSRPHGQFTKRDMYIRPAVG
jgi:hypothetical protein